MPMIIKWGRKLAVTIPAKGMKIGLLGGKRICNRGLPPHWRELHTAARGLEVSAVEGPQGLKGWEGRGFRRGRGS